MINIPIFLFILITNIVSILLIYHSFNKNIEKSKRLLYTMIAMGVIYILVLIVYALSSIGMPKETAEQSKEMITFTFVPVNSIIIIPFLLRSFNKRKSNEITTEQLNTRTIIVAIVAIVLLIGEFFYFRNIEKGINNIVEKKKNEQNAISNVTETSPNIENNKVLNNVNIENLIENSANNIIKNNTYINSTY